MASSRAPHEAGVGRVRGGRKGVIVFGPGVTDFQKAEGLLDQKAVVKRLLSRGDILLRDKQARTHTHRQQQVEIRHVSVKVKLRRHTEGKHDGR